MTPLRAAALAAVIPILAGCVEKPAAPASVPEAAAHPCPSGWTTAEQGHVADAQSDHWDGLFGSYIWAASLAEASEHAKKRGIGEVVSGPWGGREGKRCRDPYERPSVMLRRRKLDARQKLDAIHGTVFVGFLLMNCRRDHSMLDRSKALLGDLGIVHQVVHALTGTDPTRPDVARSLARLEAGIPGYVRQP